MKKKKKTVDKEFQRGYKYKKAWLEKNYRSFFKKDGVIYGYTKKGVKHIIHSPEYGTYRKGFYGGCQKAIREMLKEKPVRKVKKKTTVPKKSIWEMDIEDFFKL